MQLDAHAQAILFSLGLAVFVACIAHALSCSEQHHCIKKGTCRSVSNASFGCGFQNTLSGAGSRALNATDVGAFTRGVCAPGMRQYASVFSGSTECVRERRYPDALNFEVMSSDEADQSVPHRKYCGTWIDSQPLLVGEKKWAFFDADDVTRDLSALIASRGAARLASTDLQKFRSACRSMLASNAFGPASERAYAFLLDRLEVSNVDTSTPEAPLRAIGALASYACDAPSSVGLTDSGATFAVRVGVGVALTADALSESMYAVGVDRTARSEARTFAEAMKLEMERIERDVGDGQSSADIDASTALAIARGADASSVHARMDYARTNVPLAAFKATVAARPVAETHNYLRGLAAQCALGVHSVVKGELGNLHSSTTEHHVRTSNAQGLRVQGLGRLKADSVDLFATLNATHLNVATSASWTRMAVDAGVVGSAEGIKEQCLELARRVFPDSFDRLAFDALVTPRLFERLETISNELKQLTIQTVQLPVIAATHTTLGNAIMVQNAKRLSLRIAGAPRGSWAGGTLAEFLRPSLKADDGAMTMMLKQANAVFRDRIGFATRAEHVCNHPPLFNADVRNAYLVLSSKYACATLLPGILVPPFADERYDIESLLSRIGYVIAHEFAHVSSLKALWDYEGAEKMLLSSYAESAWPEGLADQVAVRTIMKTQAVSGERLCGHISQLWCGKRGLVQAPEREGASHPLANERGDAICRFLES
jgi:hypothetical protein